MVSAGPATAEPPAAAWAPLRLATYRTLWLALLGANVGTWMQTVGAQWLLVHEPNASSLVAMVQTASMLPILLLALPAGALADAFDRRHLLIAVQCFISLIALMLTVLTATGRMTPTLLLTLTFVLGAGQALTLPAWAAVIPELVPRSHLQSAAALGAINVNAARSVGPAVAGFLVAQAGVAVVFAVNAVSYLIFALALVRWRPGNARAVDVPEQFTSALRAGARYVRHSPVVRRLLLRATLFLVPGSALWALLPVVANRRLDLGASGYGLLLGALGIGAIVGGLFLPWVRSNLTPGQFLLLSGLVYGGALLVIALVRSVPIVVATLVPAGAAWVTVLSSVNAEMQLFLPGWIRARGLAVYQVVFAGGQAIGSFAWGLLANRSGLVVTYLAAAVLMLLGAVTVRLWPLPDLRKVGREPAVYWPELRLTEEPDRRVGPVLVTIAYRVPPDRQRAFLEAMKLVKGSRQRTGAQRWGLFREGEAEHRFVEVYQLASWDEHLRQHGGRLTTEDRVAEEKATALIEGKPDVKHLLPAGPSD
ncbi:MAG TPA: MFS transporter [Micromonosporaceae bacterium]